MARFAAFLGCRVEVHYRAGDIILPATGLLVADSGRSIFLEEHIGQTRHFRWEIPYQCIVRLEEKPANADPAADQPKSQKQHASGAAAARNTDSSLLPFRNRPKEV